MRETTCCFTGHRPDKLPWGENERDGRAAALKSRVMDAVREAYDDGFRHFLCGMARGCDMYFCEAVFALRFANPSVTLEAAVPFEGQAESFPERDRRRYYMLLRECDSVFAASEEYSRDCFMRRNRYMVDNSARLIAVYSGASGGTRQTVEYAKRRGVQVREIAPLDTLTP